MLQTTDARAYIDRIKVNTHNSPCEHSKRTCTALWGCPALRMLSTARSFHFDAHTRRSASRAPAMPPAPMLHQGRLSIVIVSSMERRTMDAREPCTLRCTIWSGWVRQSGTTAALLRVTVPSSAMSRVWRARSTLKSCNSTYICDQLSSVACSAAYELLAGCRGKRKIWTLTQCEVLRRKDALQRLDQLWRRLQA